MRTTLVGLGFILAGCSAGPAGTGGAAGSSAGGSGGAASSSTSAAGGGTTSSASSSASSGGTTTSSSSSSGAPVPDGTSCALAIDVTAATQNDMPYHGAATAIASEAASCGAGTAHVSYLRYTAAPGNYDISVTTPGGSSAPGASSAYLALRGACADPATETACNDIPAYLPLHVGIGLPTDLTIVLAGDWFANGYDLTIRHGEYCIWDDDCTDPPNYGLFCDPSTGACVDCVSLTDCPWGSVCDPAKLSCVECMQDSHCAGHDGGSKCHGQKCGCDSLADCKSNAAACNGVCYECQTAADCVDHNANTCIGGFCACASDADCVGHPRGEVCNTTFHKCYCNTSFDCPTAAAPACTYDGCGTISCGNSDPIQDTDDGPAAAVDVTPGASGVTVVSGQTICWVGGSTIAQEEDWFKLTALNGSNITIAPSWPDTAYRITVKVFDAQFNEVAKSASIAPAPPIQLTSLPAGLYYLSVTGNDPAGFGAHVKDPHAYTLQITHEL